MEYIAVKSLSKKIKGRTVLDNIHLSLPAGGIYGFFGRNASGKTMLFRALCGLIRPDSGTIQINGQVLGKEISFPKSVGVIIEQPGFWEGYTGYKNLKTLASIKNRIDDQEIFEAMNRLGLDPSDKRTYKKYSLGMKQRLAISQAVMEHPDLLILDEPTNALDEETVHQVRNVLLEENKRGTTILIASHNKEDLDILANEKFQMIDGRLLKYRAE